MPRSAEWAIPDRFPGPHIDGSDPAIRRLLAQHARKWQPPSCVHVNSIGGMRLRIARPLGPTNFPACLIARRPPLLPGLRARHQADIVGHVVIIRNNNAPAGIDCNAAPVRSRSEEHTSELQSLMRNSYAVICLKKK